MATIWKRGNLQWQARIRRKGYLDQAKTFETKADAEMWARQVESEMDRGVFVSRAEAEGTTLHEALERFTPKRKHSHRVAPQSCRARL